MNKALRGLLDLGKADEPITLLGHKWELHSLSTDEQIASVAATSNHDNFSRTAIFKLATLSRALTAVDGTPTGNVGETRELLSQMQASVINMLYDEYDAMITKHRDSLLDDEQKKEEAKKEAEAAASQEPVKEEPAETVEDVPANTGK